MIYLDSEATGYASEGNPQRFGEGKPAGLALTRQNVAAGYADLMGRYALPLFVTQTFSQGKDAGAGSVAAMVGGSRYAKTGTHPEAVVKAHRYFLGLVNDKLHGRHWRRKGILGVQSILGVERHKSGWPHSHAVIGHPDINLGAEEHRELRTALKDRCEEEWGFARLEVASSASEVNAYVSKYVVKDGELWISDHIEALNTGQLSLCR